MQKCIPLVTDRPTHKFFVYELRRPNGEPFYVGKGTGYRPWAHIRDARSGQDIRNPHKNNIIRKIEREGGVVEIAFVFESDDEDEAYAREALLIAAHRAAGIELANLTAGGSRTTFSDETRAKLSAMRKGKPRSEKTKENIRAAKTGVKKSLETCAKISAARKGIKLSPEHKEALHASRRGHPHSEETRAKISAANKGQVVSETQRMILSELRKGKPLSEETRAKMSAARIRYVERQRAELAESGDIA